METQIFKHIKDICEEFEEEVTRLRKFYDHKATMIAEKYNKAEKLLSENDCEEYVDGLWESAKKLLWFNDRQFAREKEELAEDFKQKIRALVSY